MTPGARARVENSSLCSIAYGRTKFRLVSSWPSRSKAWKRDIFRMHPLLTIIPSSSRVSYSSSLSPTGYHTFRAFPYFPHCLTIPLLFYLYFFFISKSVLINAREQGWLRFNKAYVQIIRPGVYVSRQMSNSSTHETGNHYLKNIIRWNEFLLKQCGVDTR